MESDKFKDFRKKVKYIMEIRYNPLVQAFDRRGEVLKTIHQAFEQKIPHWRAQNVEIIMSDNFEKETKHLEVTHLRSSIAYDDPGSQQEFMDDTHKFLTLFYKTFPELSSLKVSWDTSSVLSLISSLPSIPSIAWEALVQRFINIWCISVEFP